MIKLNPRSAKRYTDPTYAGNTIDDFLKWLDSKHTGFNIELLDEWLMEYLEYLENKRSE